MANREVKVTLRANVADFKSQIRSAASSLDDLAKRAGQDTAGTGMGRLTQSMQLQREEWDRLGAATLAFGTATTGALALSTKAAIDWESAFAGVRKTVDTSEAGYAALNDQLRAMARELPASHAEIASVAEAAGQLGIHEENIASFTRTMIDMGQSTNLSADEAATTLARFANIMGTSQTQFSNLGSSIVELGNNYATTEREIANMAQNLASAGHQIGLTEGDVLGMATALSSVGIEAEAGGTAFSRVMLEMRNAVDTMSPKLDTLARVAGVTSEEFARMFKETPGEAITRFVQGLGEMESAGQSTQPVLAELGMTDIRVGNALRSSAAAADLFAGAMRTGNEAFEEGTALSEEAAKRYETLASQLARFKGVIVDAAIGIGSTLAPAIEFVVDGFTHFVEMIGSLPGPVQAGVAVLGALTGAVATGAGAFMLLGPRVLEAVAAFSALRAANLPFISKSLAAVAGSASLVGKAFKWVALPAAAFSGIKYLTDISGKVDAAPVRDLASALNDIAVTGETSQESLKSLFNSKWTWDKTEVKDMTTLLSEFGRVMNDGFGDSAWEKMDRFFKDWKGSDRAKDMLRGLNSALEEMVRGGNLEQAQQMFTQLMDHANSMDLTIPQAELESYFTGYQNAVALATGETENLTGALAVAGPLIDAVADSADETATAAEELGLSEEELTAIWDAQLGTIREVIDARRGLAGEANSLFDAQVGAIDALEMMNRALADESKALNESTGSWDAHTEAGRLAHDGTRDLVQSMWDTAEAMRDQGESADEIRGTLEGLRGDWSEQVSAMGATSEQVQALADQYGVLPEEIVTTIFADTDSAVFALEGYLVEVDNATGTVKIDGDTVPGDAKLSDLMWDIANSQGEVTIDGNRFPADSTVSDLLSWVNSRDSEIEVGADTGRAYSDSLGVASKIRENVSTSIQVGAHDGGAYSAAVAIARGISSRVTATVGIRAATLRAGGGYITGPGTGTSDSIPARLSNGEYVIRASMVQRFGKEFFDAINYMGRLPGFAAGGLVSGKSVAPPIVNIAPASLEGYEIRGNLSVGDVLVPIVDGRIAAMERRNRIVGRRP